MSLGKDVYLALAAVGWADGNLDSNEADAIVKTAVEDGLDLEVIEEIEAATKAQHPLSSIDTAALSAGDRKFVYAVATWMTELDDELDAGEKKILDELAKLLQIDEAQRADIGIVVREVEYASKGDSPFEYDLHALRAKFA